MTTSPVAAREARWLMADVDPRTHTTAEQERAFDRLTDAEKFRAIWFNGRETNGAVASVIQRVDRMEPIVLQMQEQAADTHTIAAFIKLWGARGTGLLAFMIVVATFALLVARG